MGQSIVFAHYKKDEHGKDVLLGYRQDTFGTLGTKWAKIYTYSKEQVETVLKGIDYNLGEQKPSLGEALKKMGAVVMNKEGNVLLDKMIESEKKIYQDAQDAGAFEVRVLKSPGYPVEREFDVEKAEWIEKRVWQYPKEEMDAWLATPEEHEVIETHYFSKVGRLNLQ